MSALSKEESAMRQPTVSLPEKAEAVNSGILEALPAFRRYLNSRNRAPKTLKTYEEAIRRFAEFLAERSMPNSITQVRREHVESWMEHLVQNYTAATAANRYRSLQAFFKWAASDGEL